MSTSQHIARSIIKRVLMFLACATAQAGYAQPPIRTSPAGFHLIAHRGGVVDSVTPENSMASLKKAFARGYWMVEIDMRPTKDGHLITNHDASLKKYYGINRLVSEMTWEELHKIRAPGGNKILQLEEVFAYCSGRMQVMIDNKIKGLDTTLFNKIISLLKKYKLDKQAMMIGTDESTEFFTGRIKLSCTRAQLEANMKRPDYKASNYYLFGSDITGQDVQWAKKNNILPVAVVNAWTFKGKDKFAEARVAAENVIRTGADYFQIDSEYEQFFR